MNVCLAQAITLPSFTVRRTARSSWLPVPRRGHDAFSALQWQQRRGHFFHNIVASRGRLG